MRNALLSDYVVANRGEISRPSLEERRSMFSQYLGRTKFSEYRDLVEPIVRVSADGTLGWVIAQVKAKGVHRPSLHLVTWSPFDTPRTPVLYCF